MEKKNIRILITGATDGIGYHTATKLAKWGADLYLVGRNPQKTQNVANQIKNQYPHLDIRYAVYDLSLPSQVNQLAEEVKKNWDRLDVLLNNVGAFFQKKIITKEGHESTFALNHLSYFLLTLKLLDLLKKSKSARIVNTASQAHVGVDLDFENLQGEKSYNGWKAYQMSKLENILFTYELHDRLQSQNIKNITVNALHPGFVATKFGDNNPGLLGSALKIAKALFAINQDKGSETSFYLCTSPEVEGVSGKYFDECKPKTSSPQSRNKETARKLWEVTEGVLSLPRT